MSFILAMLAMLAGQTAEAPPADAPPAAIVPGTVAVRQPAPVGRQPSPELPFAEELGVALADAGFTLIPGVDHARYVASYEIKRVAGGAVVSKGSGTSVLGVNAGGGVSLGLGGSSQVGQLVSTELIVRLTRRGETEPAWEGRAVTQQVSGSRGDSPAVLAAKLSGALFRNFPQPSGLSISVP